MIKITLFQNIFEQSFILFNYFCIIINKISIQFFKYQNRFLIPVLIFKYLVTSIIIYNEYPLSARYRHIFKKLSN